MKYDIVLKSLKMSLVNAYMITGRRGEIFGEIIPYYLPEVCEELAEEDSSYTDFLLHSEEKTGGRGTRLGIVPFGMSFDTFNSKFNKAFKEATKRYVENRVRDTVPEDEIAANLIRIMPSEAFFKRVIGGEKTEDVTSEEHPITTIRNLIIEHYSPVRNFELVASLKGGEEATVNMKTLLTELLNTHSRIFLYVEEEVREIVGETGIFEKMKSGEFDNQLIQEFKAKSLSALCVAVYKAQKKGAAYSDSVMVKMTSFVNKLQKRHHKKIGEDQIKLLVEPIIFVLESWGAIIEGFSGEIPELP
jgi:predicted Zn-dependent protease